LTKTQDKSYSEMLA